MNVSVEQQTALPWNKGKLVGQKTPLRLKDIWTIRIRLKLANDVRNLALFNLVERKTGKAGAFGDDGGERG